MSAGSLWPAVKAAYCDAWRTLAGLANVSVLYRDPLLASEVANDYGGNEAVWWEGAATGQLEVIELGTPVIANETLSAAIIVQVIGTDTADTAEVVEARAAELLGAVVDHIANTPRLVVASGWDDVIVSLQGTVTWVAVPMQSADRAATRCRIQVQIEGSRC